MFFTSPRKAIWYSVNVAFITISFIPQDVALIRQISLSTKQLAEAEDDTFSSLFFSWFLTSTLLTWMTSFLLVPIVISMRTIQPCTIIAKWQTSWLGKRAWITTPSLNLATGHKDRIWHLIQPRQNVCCSLSVRCQLPLPVIAPSAACCWRKALEQVKSTKLLGMYLKENLKWDVLVKHLASTCYGTLANLRKIKNFTTFTLRKHLAESLIISRLDFSDIVFYPLTEHLLKRLQRIQYSAASFVTGRYVNSIESILKLSWSPMREGTGIFLKPHIRRYIAAIGLSTLALKSLNTLVFYGLMPMSI